MERRRAIDKTDIFRVDLDAARKTCEPIDRAIGYAERVLSVQADDFYAAPYHPGCLVYPLQPPCETSFILIFRVAGDIVVFERLRPVPSPPLD